MNHKNYNVGELDPKSTFDRHIYHRDHFAHYLRWTHILKVAKRDEIVVDFGCGRGNLLEVLYRNRVKQKVYVGIDIMDRMDEKLKTLDWVKFYQEDIVKPVDLDFKLFKADRVVSFEVIEHVGKQNVHAFLKNFKDCGHPNATYYLSSPNYDEKVGASKPHIYDSGHGEGKQIHEFEHKELQGHIEDAGFIVIDKFGTFASIRDYKPLMNDWQAKMFDHLRRYYSSDLVSNLMAPFFPEQARNCLWVLKRSIL